MRVDCETEGRRESLEADCRRDDVGQCGAAAVRVHRRGGEREGRGQVRLSGLVRSRLLIFAASMLVGPMAVAGSESTTGMLPSSGIGGMPSGNAVGILPSTSTCAMF